MFRFSDDPQFVCKGKLYELVTSQLGPGWVEDQSVLLCMGCLRRFTEFHRSLLCRTVRASHSNLRAEC